MKRIYVYIVCLFVSFSGCIEEYTPNNIESVRDILIIEGNITNDESVFILRRSVGLTETLTGREVVNHASLCVETDDGQKLTGISKGDGVYSVLTGVLNSDRQYRLRISLDGEEYESSFLYPSITPEIDSLSVTKEGPGKPVFINVSTHDTEGKSTYYQWSYKEIWEYHTELFANAGTLNGVFMNFDQRSQNNTYYCWARNSSNSLLLGSSERLSQNIISQKRLLEIPSDHDKLSILYYVLVEQKQIRKETYDYYINLQKNVEQTGGIFSSIPSEIKGNIICTTNPDISLIGYVEVATTTIKSFFLPTSAGLYEPSKGDCSNKIIPVSEWTGGMPPPIYVLGESYAPSSCVDCRSIHGGTKNKPDFWPTDHL